MQAEVSNFFMYPSGSKALRDSRAKQIWCTIDFLP